MKKNKLVVLLLLLLLVGAGVYTYSRYTSTFEGSGTFDVAKWAVTVTDANEAKEFDLTLTPVANENVADGKIAPGSSATGTIELDLTGTEVTTDYTVTIGDLIDVPAGFAVTSIKAGDALLNDENDYTGTITHEEIATNPKVNLTITVTWENSDANDATDTAAGIDAGEITVPVTVLLQQHIGE